MKKLTLISLLLFVGFMPSVYSQNESEALIVFYRENNSFGSAVGYPIFMNDSLVVTLKNASYAEYLCPPGEYFFRIDNSDEPQLELTVEANETYFLRAGIIMGTWKSTYELILVDRISAEKSLLSGKLKVQEVDNTPYVVPKNRIGIDLSMGFGLKSHDLVEMEDGDFSSFSFGGGFGISAIYGREFSDKFDLSFQLGYKISQLSPYLENAKFDFQRGVLSVTPAYVIKIKEKTRLRLGAGPDCYFGNSMKIRGSKVSGGFDDKWKYSTAVGFHASAIFAFYVVGQISWDLGLRYYNVTYKFNNSDKNYYPTTGSGLDKGNGSGIDFIVRLNYHF